MWQVSGSKDDDNKSSQPDNEQGKLTGSCNGNSSGSCNSNRSNRSESSDGQRSVKSTDTVIEISPEVSQKEQAVQSESEDESLSSDEEEFLKYHSTSFASSLAQLGYTQSRPVDSVIGSGYGTFDVGGIITSSTSTSISSSSSTKPKFAVSLQSTDTKQQKQCENKFSERRHCVEDIKDIQEAVITPFSSVGAQGLADILTSSGEFKQIHGLITDAKKESPEIITGNQRSQFISGKPEVTVRVKGDNQTSAINRSSLSLSPSPSITLNPDNVQDSTKDTPKGTSEGTEKFVDTVENVSPSEPRSRSSSSSSSSHTRNDRYSGQEGDVLISRTPDTVRVHSQRPGGWEGISHELVYPLSPDEWRREARRRKWHTKESTQQVVESVRFKITVNRKSSEPNRDCYRSSLEHSTVTVADRNLPFFKPGVGRVNTVTFETTPEIYGTDEIPAKMTDKETLVERSESFEENTSPDTLSKDNFTSISVQLNPAYPVCAQKSPDEQDTVMSVDYTKGVDQNDSGDNKNNGNVISRWEGRVNPFNDEDFEADEVFTTGIIDLDDPEAENKARLRKSSSLDSPGTIPSKESLSEAEEQINLKTQFKGVYYNIGSTEDLLKELAIDDERDGHVRQRSSKTRPSNSSKSSAADSSGANSEVEDKDTTEGKVIGGTNANNSKKRGKLLKYESLDLDIDHSNPFYDEVYQEYDRRTGSKPGNPSDAFQASKSGSTKSRSKLENIPESNPHAANEGEEDQEGHALGSDGDRRREITDADIRPPFPIEPRIIDDQGSKDSADGSKSGDTTSLTGDILHTFKIIFKHVGMQSLFTHLALFFYTLLISFSIFIIVLICKISGNAILISGVK